jgi:HAD superfamily hydrolase (TIGR01509 family)
MDGTLLDSEPIWHAEESAMTKELQIPWNDEDSHSCLGGPISKVDSLMRAKAEGRFQEGELAEILISRMATRLQQGVKFASGAEALLNEMKNESIKLGLVTASARHIVDSALRTIDGYFSSIISADDILITKPDPSGYKKAAEELGSDIRESLILEDSPNGMKAAIASGAFVLGLRHGKELPSGEKVRFVNNLHGVTFSDICRLFDGDPSRLGDR